VAQRIAQVVFQFMTALQQVYQPTVYRMLFASAPPAEIGRYLLPWAYASAAGALAAILFAKEALRLVTGPEFWGGDVMIGVLAVHYGLMFFGKQPQLIFGQRMGLVSVLSITSVFFNAVSVYIGATQAGGIGAAVGTLLSGVLLGAASLYLSQRVAPIGYPVRTTAAAFSSLPVALALIVMARKLSLSAEALLLLKLLVVGFFAMLGWRSGVLATLRQAGNIPDRQPKSQ
jgi:O-antigen/teichoic acid export membrane protein